MSVLKISNDGYVSINGVRIEGVVESPPVIKNAVIIDRRATNATSGKSTAFTGYDDAQMNISISMYTDDKYRALELLAGAFKKLENKQPVIYTLDFPLARALNIKSALIKNLSVRDSQNGSPIVATITLVETNPQINNVQQQQNPFAGIVAQVQAAVETTESVILSVAERARSITGG